MQALIEQGRDTEKGTVCLLTLVVPGLSDQVLKIFPATGKVEKIWMDKTQGIERWAQVRRILQMSAKRGEYVSEPVPYHPDVANLRTTELTWDTIPQVNLEEGNVFEVLVIKERPNPKPVGNAKLDNLELRMEKLEGTLGKLTGLLEKMTTAPEKKKPGRPKKNQTEE